MYAPNCSPAGFLHLRSFASALKMFLPVNDQSVLDALSTTACSWFHAIWSPKCMFAISAIICSLIFRDFESTTKGVTAPIAGRWRLEPYFLTGLRFKRWSMLHLNDGYNKVRPQLNLERRACGICTKISNISSNPRCSKSSGLMAWS